MANNGGIESIKPVGVGFNEKVNDDKSFEEKYAKKHVVNNPISVHNEQLSFVPTIGHGESVFKPSDNHGTAAFQA